MESILVKTRTMPPTETKGKRVHVEGNDGRMAEYSWNHQYSDAPDMHLFAVNQLIGPRPSHTVTVQQISTQAMGYTYRVLIEERQA
jgi:hypothetical protein